LRREGVVVDEHGQHHRDEIGIEACHVRFERRGRSGRQDAQGYPGMRPSHGGRDDCRECSRHRRRGLGRSVHHARRRPLHHACDDRRGQGALDFHDGTAHHVRRIGARHHGGDTAVEWPKAGQRPRASHEHLHVGAQKLAQRAR
jgi:hypothetical protein